MMVARELKPRAKDFTPAEITEILKKEEQQRRRKAKAREKEILRLIEEQKWDLAGKLWGEESFDQLKAEAEAKGKGGDWNYTDIEAEICSDVRDYTIDPDALAQPEEDNMVREAWEIASEVVCSKWHESGLESFFLWLGEPLVDLCKEKRLPPTSTLELIKEMVLECRREAGSSEIFPFDLEEREIRRLTRRITLLSAQKRRISNESQPADPKSRVWLKDILPGFDKMSLGAIHVALEKQGYKISRNGAWRAKRSGWFSQPNWKRGIIGEVVQLSEEDKKSTLSRLTKKYGIAMSTASKARKRGFFVVNQDNRNRVKKPSSEMSQTKSVSLPEKVHEVAGRKVRELSVEEMVEHLGFTKRKAGEIIARGYLSIIYLSEEKRADLAARIKKLEKEGWPKK